MKFKDILNESNLARIHQHTKERNIGIITAYRGDKEKKENESNQDILKSEIKKAGYGYIPVKGRYIEGHGTDKATPVDEASLLVVGKKGDDSGELLNFLKTHGEKYNQDSVLHKKFDENDAKLHGTSKTSEWPEYGKAESVGEWHPNKVAEFHTVMKNKKPFAFLGEDVDVLSGNFWYEPKQTTFLNRSLFY